MGLFSVSSAQTRSGTFHHYVGGARDAWLSLAQLGWLSWAAVPVANSFRGMATTGVGHQMSWPLARVWQLLWLMRLLTSVPTCSNMLKRTLGEKAVKMD